ncbi:MAG: M20/M25/M40 family metallo-hydrolase [Flavobacteriaceae bacterium]|nr:M20/M25/M40 family metallo-hydrolase [Flavobacteriaceae bacterium]
MKRILLGLAVFMVFIGNAQKSETMNTIAVSIDDIKATVSFLASDNINGRDTGSDGIDKAATYIEKQLASFEVKPYYETYRDHFKVKALDAYNVVGFLEGNDPELKKEVVIIGAHYDHIGLRAKVVNGDTIANGANDNASGTATVLAMAKYFGKAKTNKRSIIFALFSAEEMGLKGSKHLAERLSNEKLNMYTMINYEMMGVPFTDRSYQAMITGYDLSNMGEVLNDHVGKELFGKSDEAVKYNLFKRSDNYAFYTQFKKPAQTISTCDLTNFDFYHHVDDEADKMDYDFMATIINDLFPAMEGMINAPTQEIKMNISND